MSSDGLRGKAVAVTFLDTQARGCPIVAAQMGEAIRLLRNNAARRRRARLSVDPVNDTPARIRSFLTRFRALDEIRYVDGTWRSSAGGRCSRSCRRGHRLEQHALRSRTRYDRGALALAAASRRRPHRSQPRARPRDRTVLGV